MSISASAPHAAEDDQTRRRIVAVLAHPDDETFIIGGTLALYAAGGYDVRVVYGPFGPDAGGMPTRERIAELEAAVRVLGLTEWRCLPHIDTDGAGSDDGAPTLSGAVLTELRRLRPDVVITFDATGATGHPEHIAIGAATDEAALVLNDEAGSAAPQTRLYAAVFARRQLAARSRVTSLFRRGTSESMRTAMRVAEEQRPTTYIDVRGVLAQRRAAARCYPSALREGAWWMRRWELLSPRLRRLLAPREVYARLIPPAPPGLPPETDLFSSGD